MNDRNNKGNRLKESEMNKKGQSSIVVLISAILVFIGAILILISFGILPPSEQIANWLAQNPQINNPPAQLLLGLLLAGIGFLLYKGEQ